jgi:SAM-dependent methyltransferase
MDTTSQADNPQATHWNGRAGQAWVDIQGALDQMFKPLEALLLEAVPAGSCADVLDVGCGTGAVTLAAARRLGESGRATGVDISQPMITHARARAEHDGTPASFLLADAQTHPFAPASFDMILSRLGVMFFPDPVQAFGNLRRAAKEEAELRFVAWRSAADNPFMTTAARAAAPLMPNIPARQPDAPGQFGFADHDRVGRILRDGGWTGIEISPIDVVCALPETALISYVTRLGPLGGVLHEVDEATRAKVIDVVSGAFEQYVDGAEVRFTAALWMARASAGSTSAAL